MFGDSARRRVRRDLGWFAPPTSSLQTIHHLFLDARVLLLVLALKTFSIPPTVVRRYEFDSIGGDSTFPMLFFPAAGATSQKTFSTGPINA